MYDAPARFGAVDCADAPGVSLVIAGDTGPLHLACALGKPVVGIYGPTDPGRNGPFGGAGSWCCGIRRASAITPAMLQPEAGSADHYSRARWWTQRGILLERADGRDWSRVARRIRVPMGFLFAAFYLWRPGRASISWLEPAAGCARASLRAYASGYVKKNAELTVTGPYAYTRNPLVSGIGAHGLRFRRCLPQLVDHGAAGAPLCRQFMSRHPLRGGNFCAPNFPRFDGYAQHVPRLLPRLTPARMPGSEGSFSGALYRQHREYNALMGAWAVYAVLMATLCSAIDSPERV